MKTGLTLAEMATELQRRHEAKRDFVADTRHLTVTTAGQVALSLPNEHLVLTEGPVFQEQVCGHFKIPRDYASRIRQDHPELYRDTLNTFFGKEPTRRMVRALDGTARAFLSDRYRPLDNFELANAVLPVLMDHKDIRIESTEFTDRRFYLKAVFPRIQTEVKRGDVVQIGVMVSNSEVGSGALQVMPLLFRLVCLNGMIAEDYGQRRYHVGKRAAEEQAAFELYTDKTKALDDAAFFSKVQDTVKGVLTQDVLTKLASRLKEATEQPLEAKSLQSAVEVTAQRFGYTEATKDGILRHLIEGGDLSRYGLMNAITRQAQDEESYERATQLEMDGSRIIELPQTDWRAIAEAA